MRLAQEIIEEKFYSLNFYGKKQLKLCGVEDENTQVVEYVSDEAQYIYERVRDRYNPDMAKNLISRSQD